MVSGPGAKEIAEKLWGNDAIEVTDAGEAARLRQKGVVLAGDAPVHMELYRAGSMDTFVFADHLTNTGKAYPDVRMEPKLPGYNEGLTLDGTGATAVLGAAMDLTAPATYGERRAHTLSGLGHPSPVRDLVRSLTDSRPKVTVSVFIGDSR
jgi:hypothetical protein